MHLHLHLLMHLRRLVLLWLLLGHALPAFACAICAPADGQNTLLYQMYAADAVVLATPQLPGTGYRVVAQVKGSPPPEPIAMVQWTVAAPATGALAPAVLLYSAAGHSWRAVGTLDPARAAWLSQLVRSFRPVGIAPEPDWPRRLAAFVAELEDPEPLLARVAYEEVSVAPYGAMRSMQPRLDRARIRRWLDDPGLTARRPLYLLLAGLAGGADAAQDLRMRIDGARRDGSAASLSAALAAYVEVEGAAGVTWIEQEFFVRPGRDEFQVQAAVLALAVHGGDGARVGRDRVVAAFTRLASGNPAMAGFAAADLAGWGHWELGPVYAQILRSGQPLVFASRYAMVFYLLRSPRPDAREAIEALRAAKAL